MVRTGFFEFLNLFADELKAGEDVDHGHTVCFADFVSKLGADDGFDGGGIGRQLIFKLSCFNDIGKQHNADLVAGERHKFAV